MKIKNLCLALVALSLLATPAAAQKRSNKGGAMRGDARADQVQVLNQSKVKKDKDRDPAASTNKTKGLHKAHGHRH